MSIANEINRINNSVNLESTIIDEIFDILNDKSAVSPKLQEKRVTPNETEQNIIPDNGYDGLSKVVVNKIPQDILDEYYQKGYNDAKPYSKELLYIQSSGTQYIDSEFVADLKKLDIEMKFIYSGAINDVSLYGSEVAGEQFDGVPYSQSNNVSFYVGTTRDILNYPVSMNTEYILKSTIENNKITVDINGEQKTANFSGNIKTGRNMTIFANNSSENVWQKASLKLYYFKIKSDNKLVRDFIPVLDFDNTPCLYDKVRKQKHYNKGTGSFMFSE